MFVPIWIIVALAVVAVLFVMWALAAARGRNPLPFPDGGSRIFAAASPEAKDALVALLEQHGLKARFRADSGGVQRTILWDGTIINHSSPEVLDKLGHPAGCIGLVAADPARAAEEAVVFLRARGFAAEVAPDIEAGLPIVFVKTDALSGTVLNFRKSVIHMPKPQKA
jgi:hypothetical protein